MTFVSEPLRCTRCNSYLPAEILNQAQLRPCPACGVQLQIEVFPAYFEPLKASSSGEMLVLESEASCFYHPTKKAAVPCDTCGRFLCSLCEVQMGEQHLCPPCLRSGVTKGKVPTLEPTRLLHDNIALGTAILPFLAWPLTLFTAPVAIVLGFRSRKQRSSITPRTSIRSIAAILIGVLTLAGWAAVFYYFLRGRYSS